MGYFPISETEIALYSIDVSGHGIASALLTGRLAGLFTGSRGAQHRLPVGRHATCTPPRR